MAIENLEGPDGKPFKYEVGFVMDYYQALYPVVGIPDPVRFITDLENAGNSGAKRLFVLFGDRFNKDLYRLQAVDLLCNNAQNALYYQARLDQAKAGKTEPDPKPLIGTPSAFERSEMLETARREIDNTALLIELLESNDQVILDIAPSKDLEDIRRLGPDLVKQLKTKLRIMNEHWIDYNRLFTTPNL
jgi:hypothetical protein